MSINETEGKRIATIITNEILQKKQIKNLQKKTNIYANLYQTEKFKVKYYEKQITSIRINTIIWAIIVGTAYYLGTRQNK